MLRFRWALAAALACALTACKREPSMATPASTPTPPAPSAPAAPPAPARAPRPAATNATPVESVAVTSATLGSAINADKRVTAATDTFRSGDTIFIAVETSGAAGASLTARWTFDPVGQPARVNEETQKVPPGGPSVTEFHVRKPDGWPHGDYQVVVLANGEPAVTKRFKVL
jgi:hypothetical protein